MTDRSAYRMLHQVYESLAGVVLSRCPPSDIGYRRRASRLAKETREYLEELERRTPELREAALEGKI